MASKSLLKAAPEGAQIEIDGESHTVKPQCEEKQDGHWYCLTHQEGFSNQLMKDIHIDDRAHILTWICHAHGPEVP